jgi:hypothetical protein
MGDETTRRRRPPQQGAVFPEAGADDETMGRSRKKKNR